MNPPLLKCLFIEDSREDLEIIRRSLDEMATVTGAATRAELEDALQSSWDVVLADLRLHDIDGEEAIRIVKAKNPLTPVLIVTGSVDDDSAALACQSGACDYLRKDRLRRLRMAVQNAYDDAQRKRRELMNQRLELLGEAVTGLSHDLRNVLSVILAGVEIVRPKTQPAEERILDVMTSSVRRAEEMLTQILAFGRGDSGELQKVSTEHIVGEISSLLRAGTFPSNIEVQITTAIGTASIRCDENQINRALWNLVLNAKQAMPDGGQLIISAQNVTLHDPEGEHVMISIKDSGVGIPQAAMERLFEPFFTTRRGQGGTGLGLAMTKQIIAAHGGTIGVTSDAGGTEFKVFLPVAGEKHNHLPAFDGRGATVLVVEDDTFLRSWEALRLENANYRVLEAPNGAAAMSIFLKHLDNVDEVQILLTDLTMPAMQGNELAKALLQLKPDLKVIYVSGLDSVGTFKPEPTAVLEKPFPSVRLLEVLRDVTKEPK